jgi:hypothetical protein
MTYIVDLAKAEALVLRLPLCGHLEHLYLDPFGSLI